MPKPKNRWLQKRSTEQEALDNLNLSGALLHHTLDGLSIINRFLGNTNATFNAVKPIILHSRVPPKIIDLGCGGGDNLRAIASWCHRQNQPVHLLGIDGNAHILAYARSKNTNLISPQYQQANILDPNFKLPTCDLLISSHFIYHFSDKSLIRFLKTSKTNISHAIIFSELRRSKLAYYLFKFGSIFMPFPSMVKKDGLKAIRRSFIKSELENILREAEIGNFVIRRKWAFRWEVVVLLKY